MTRRSLVAHALLWTAAIVAAVLMRVDAFFTTILLPSLATAAFLSIEKRPGHGCLVCSKFMR